MDQTHRDKAPEKIESNNSSVEVDYGRLVQSLWYSEKQFKEENNSQGIVGRYYDGLKTYMGGSQDSDSMLGRAWSNVLNYDESSVAVEKRF